MQFSIKTVLAVAVSMAAFAFAVPQGTVDVVPVTAGAAAPAEASVTVTEINSSASSTLTEVIPAPSNTQLVFRCCAFTGCKVCADYGTINDCSPCGGVSHIPPFARSTIRAERLVLINHSLLKAYPWCCAL